MERLRESLQAADTQGASRSDTRPKPVPDYPWCCERAGHHPREKEARKVLEHELVQARL